MHRFAIVTPGRAYDVPMLAATELEVDWVSRVLFESPWSVVVVLAVVWMVMRIVGRRTDNTALRRASWVPLVLIGGLWLTSMVVTTKRERLNQALDRLLLSVEDRDFTAFRTIVPKSAVALFPPGRGAERFTRAMVERRLEDTDVRDLILLGSESAVMDNGEAVTVIRVRAQGDYAGIEGVQAYTWAIQWRYEQDRWRAHHFECLEIGFTFGSDED